MQIEKVVQKNSSERDSSEPKLGKRLSLQDVKSESKVTARTK